MFQSAPAVSYSNPNSCDIRLNRRQRRLFKRCGLLGTKKEKQEQNNQNKKKSRAKQSEKKEKQWQNNRNKKKRSGQNIGTKIKIADKSNS
ncbi:hypothetical protein [Methanolapillus africanus]|uniref:hypothetical protein n=1 Tax=Methanolapillus africanus TaxID=3028297 RepID=UPI0030B871B3